ncbi:Hsp70 family protein [Nocardia harenae]|uniref:Hsp70 family protein n=1 Tax=Nocardia harenae TaxID=358707 RepID=UPI00082987B8|nr:Hsp70 family protein [Nocardia harenae]
MNDMVLVLGVSAGAGGARAVLTHSDQPHLPPIDRCHVPGTPDNVEAAVFEAVRLMRAAASARDELITGTAVTCRCAPHADTVRAAAGIERVTIVDEPLAQLRYLRFSGQVSDDAPVLLYDLGSSGLTLTHADTGTETVLESLHSAAVSGDRYDTLLRQRLAEDGVLPDEDAVRQHREALSRAKVITASDPDTGGRAVITRSDLAELCSQSVRRSATLVRRLVDDAEEPPYALVLLGGCARNPEMRAELAGLVDLPLIYDPEPEYVSARGAVLVAAGHRGGEVRMRHRRVGAALAALPAKAAAAREAARQAGPEHRGNRRAVLAAAGVTVVLGATVAGLLIFDRDSPAPVAPPATVEVADLPTTTPG